MKIVMAPDKFAGTLSAHETADALAAGWRSVRPDDELRLLPMSDGGPGFCAVLADAIAGSYPLAVTATDPLGRPVPALVLRAGNSAYVESAQAVGLHLLTSAERNPEITTSAGLAVLLAQAVRSGASRLVVGLGGSATNDGGQGMIEALDSDTLEALRDMDLVIASDVRNPLLGPNGASAIFGPQKGADREAVMRLEGRLMRWAEQLPGLSQIAQQSGAGAAGGLGAALLWLGGRREAGAAVVAAAIELERRLDDADLVITGEGTYDATSLRGKVVATVATAAQQAALPCLVVAGQVSVGHREAAAHGVDDVLALDQLAGSVTAAMEGAAQWVEAASARLARTWGTR